MQNKYKYENLTKRENKTLSLSDLIEGCEFAKMNNNSGVKKIVKQSTIFSFWEDIVGKKFVKFTKPTGIKAQKLFVSAKSPVIVQELSLCKKRLLDKINSYSKPLGISINDIVFCYKNYTQTNPVELISDNKPAFISDECLQSVEIDNFKSDKIIENINKIKFLNNEQKENFISKIITTYKAKAFRKS